MSASHYEITVRIPKPHRGWLRFRLRTLLLLVAAVCVVLAFDEQFALPWTRNADRRAKLLYLGDFENLRKLNLSEVMAILGAPDSKESSGKGVGGVYEWQTIVGVPPFSKTYRLKAHSSRDGRIGAGGLSVNEFRP